MGGPRGLPNEKCMFHSFFLQRLQDKKKDIYSARSMKKNRFLYMIGDRLTLRQWIAFSRKRAG
jgi:hypothetical protein